MLSSYSNANQTNWDLYLPLVLLAYRTSVQSTNKESPFALLFGREPRLPSDLDKYNYYRACNFIESLHEGWAEAKRQVIKQAKKSKETYDSKLKTPSTFKEGDLVRLNNPVTKVGLKKKLRNDIWSAIAKVKRVVSPQNLEIEINNKTKIVNINNLKRAYAQNEEIRKVPTVTRYGRISRPRFC